LLALLVLPYLSYLLFFFPLSSLFLCSVFSPCSHLVLIWFSPCLDSLVGFNMLTGVVSSDWSVSHSVTLILTWWLWMCCECDVNVLWLLLQFNL
jgi:hypothetical protein